jgi:hypothetical protein
MDTPKKPVTPKNPKSTASSPRRSPGSPAFKAKGPLEQVDYRYAAGVLPITYTINEKTREMEWKILLCIEFRRLEQRLCIHPLAGKKEKIDEDYPIKTAVREFTEESYGVYKEELLESDIESQTRDHSSWLFIQDSRMYFFYTYLPYTADIQERFLLAKGENKTGEALFWFPLDDFIRLKGRISTPFAQKDILPSDCCLTWFKNPSFRDGYLKMKDLVSKRLAQSSTHLPSTLSTPNESSNPTASSSQVASSTQVSSSAPIAASSHPTPSNTNDPVDLLSQGITQLALGSTEHSIETKSTTDQISSSGANDVPSS